MAMGHTTGHKSVDFASIMSDRDEDPYPSAATRKEAIGMLTLLSAGEPFGTPEN